MSLRDVVPAGTFHFGVGTVFLISEKVPCVYLCKDTVDDFMHTFFPTLNAKDFTIRDDKLVCWRPDSMYEKLDGLKFQIYRWYVKIPNGILVLTPREFETQFHAIDDKIISM